MRLGKNHTKVMIDKTLFSLSKDKKEKVFEGLMGKFGGLKG